MPTVPTTDDVLPQYADIALEAEELARCPECHGLVDDQGFTTDPHGCCYWCRTD